MARQSITLRRPEQHRVVQPLPHHHEYVGQLCRVPIRYPTGRLAELDETVVTRAGVGLVYSLGLPEHPALGQSGQGRAHHQGLVGEDL